MKRHFMNMLNARWGNGCHVCVGLDTTMQGMPSTFRESPTAEAMFNFNRWIIDQTKDVACAYKPNVAFYEAEGVAGSTALGNTVRYLQHTHPDIPIIVDAKRGDIGNTNDGYVTSAFTELNADAITLSPYMGKESLEPFLKMEDKGLFFLCRTSNKGSDEFQNLVVEDPDGGLTMPLYQYVAQRIATHWNTRGNCGLVAGATFPAELGVIRALAGDMPLLIPGIGAQGGDVGDVVPAGKNKHGTGMVINSSRGIIFAPNPGAEAKKLNDQIISFL